jgi:hypothetical protein
MFGTTFTMSAPAEGKPSEGSVRRVLAAVASVAFLALALKMGAESFHARSAGAPMNNWKGGTMAYQDGFKLTVVFVAFGACFCYVAVRSKRSR